MNGLSNENVRTPDRNYLTLTGERNLEARSPNKKQSET